jgi:hypothetical protein
MRQDVRETLGSLNALRAEFERYPIDLRPDHAFSPASIVKAYFKKMGLIPPLQKFRLSPRIQGIAAQAFYGGRAECRIRHTSVPVGDGVAFAINSLIAIRSFVRQYYPQIAMTKREVAALLGTLKPK